MPKRALRILILAAILIAAALAVRLIFFGTPFAYTGTVEVTNIDLASQVPSIISNVNVHEGDRVRAGEPLIRLDCGDLRIAQRLAEENYARAVKLFAVGSMPKETYDQVVNRKQDADLRVSWCDIRSPIDGRVLARYHEPAEWVNPGTKILTVADIQDAWAYIYVPQPLIAKLRYGESLVGTLPELGNRKFNGKIVWINDQAEFTPKNVQTRAERTRLVFSVKVRFENPEEILKPGMSIEVALPE